MPAPRAAVRELVVVQPARKLRLLEIGRNLLVRHLLVASPDEVLFLGLAPGSSSARHDCLAALGYTLLVSFDRLVLGDVTCHRHGMCVCVVSDKV